MKKILSLCLIFIMLFGTAYAQDTADIQSHTQDLKKLGIMVGDEDGNLRLDDNITRAEAAKMICVAAGLSTQAADGGNVFPDVPDSHWGYKYIYALNEKEIVCGDENGNFNPENNITNEEIIKMVVGILGYSPMAEVRGGYPAGFKMIASQYGITEGFSFETDTPAIRADVALIIYRALDIPIMEEFKKPDAVEYKILNGENGTIRKTLRDGIPVE